MELTKAEVFRRKSFLVSITNDIKSYLETTTPTPPPVSYENCFYIAETTKCLTDYIINNNDVKLAKEILEIDMSLWDKEKGYLDLDPFCKKGWEILRQIEKVEENISLLRDWYNNNSTQTAHKQDSTEPQQEQTTKGKVSSTPQIPSVLNNDRANKYFAKAMEAGLMNEKFEWQKTKFLLASFCRELSIKLDLGKGRNSNGEKRLCWKPFEQLFNVPNGSLRACLNDIQKTGNSPIGIEKIDAIFEK
ncbi:MAG: hypothetical protein VZQ98_06060 [Bacteroidales bacterium]|nr:hypothetical protein [Bacteroidales bacterium]